MAIGFRQIGLVKASELLGHDDLPFLLKTIKSLTMVSDALPVLQAAGTIEALIRTYSPSSLSERRLESVCRSIFRYLFITYLDHPVCAAGNPITRYQLTLQSSATLQRSSTRRCCVGINSAFAHHRFHSFPTQTICLAYAVRFRAHRERMPRIIVAARWTAILCRIAD